jgi:thiol-disulfide isomerase/thioredoxin
MGQHHQRTPITETIGALALAILVVTATSTAGEFPDDYFFSGAKRPAQLRALEGKPASEIVVDTWIGDTTSIADHQGDVIILDFWATWCGPCVASIPHNIELVNRYGDQGFTFIGIHDSKSGWDRADAMVKSKGVNYPVAKDSDGQTTSAYNLQFWPTYIAIDRTGTIRAAGLRPDKVEDVVKVLIAEDGGNTRTAKAGEFPDTWYVGGDKRPSSLRTLEGAPAPPLATNTLETWVGTALPEHATQGKVTVLRFIAPNDLRTKANFATWQKQATKLGPHGVTFLGICDPKAKWADLESIATPHATNAMPIALDRAPANDALPMGERAAAYGVRLWPTTIIIDRNGTVRAAGLRDEHVQDVITTLLSEPTRDTTDLNSKKPNAS